MTSLTFIKNSNSFEVSRRHLVLVNKGLRCQANLIEDLFDDGYDFLLTACFQSDPLESCFSQYRQMSGAGGGECHFLVSLKDTVYSEKF